MEYLDFKELIEDTIKDFKKPSVAGNWIPYTIPTGGTYKIDLPEGYKVDLEKLQLDLNDIHQKISIDYNNSCDHEYINVGFHFDKFVCKKCNKDKP